MSKSESAIEKFIRAPVATEPTPHLICEDFLDPSDLGAICNAIPHIEERRSFAQRNDILQPVSVLNGHIVRR